MPCFKADSGIHPIFRPPQLTASCFLQHKNSGKATARPVIAWPGEDKRFPLRTGVCGIQAPKSCKFFGAWYLVEVKYLGHACVTLENGNCGRC